MPWELSRLMGRERATAALNALRPLERLQETIAGLENERCIVSALELSWYMRNQLLRDADWAGMVHGVEIRVPFVDVTVLRALAPMLAGRTRRPRRSSSKAISAPLADDIATRRKTGFSVPVRDWLRAELPRVSRERGLRGWARVVGRLKGGRRFLSFVTDAYGGHGGIALYNRDLLQALCSFPGCTRVVAFPRTMPNAPNRCRQSSRTSTAAVGGKLRYLATALRLLRGDRSHDLSVCGHINLLPMAWLATGPGRTAVPVHLWHRRVAVHRAVRSANAAWQSNPLGVRYSDRLRTHPFRGFPSGTQHCGAAERRFLAEW
jgi:hypothetical protein